ncbi:hypothetical protein C8R42DRAFT_584991, partial [Lentinula raphanica]
LGPDFNLTWMLVIDLMHEFELGIWQALFSHLIRVLYVVGQQYVEYYPRAFANNASEMKKLAARDFEDLLQVRKTRLDYLIPSAEQLKCSIPVFKNLLPDDAHNATLMTLLYRMAEWHALAKLRMHSEDTLEYLETVTRQLGKLMRIYRKLLNLLTYKWHALPDYVPSIRWFGPTDSTSTQVGELAHRVVKRLYSLGNKKKDPQQIALDRRGIHTKQRRQQSLLNTENVAELLAAHHHIGRSLKHKHNIGAFVQEHQNDPAAKNFWPKLQDHLLGRLMNCEFDGDTHESFTDADRNHIRLKGGHFVSLKTCRINYTTYDVRRDQDTINPRNHADVMMLSGENGPDAHPYWYARVIGIYRATVISTHPQANTAESGPQDLEFLWVRWLGIDSGHRSGAHYARLPKVGFIDESDPFAFGFLNPARVIRSCHLMPAFSDDRTGELLKTKRPTVARKPRETDDWSYFYVGM